MAPALAEAALEQLTPDQRNAITASQAQEIMETCVAAAGTIGRILEGDANPPGRAAT